MSDGLDVAFPDDPALATLARCEVEWLAHVVGLHRSLRVADETLEALHGPLVDDYDARTAEFYALRDRAAVVDAFPPHRWWCW